MAAGYKMDPTTGALTPVPGSPYTAGTVPQFITITPSGRFVYVTNFGDNTISGFSVDPANGSLTAIPGSPFTTGSEPAGITVHQSGKWLYKANYGSAVSTVSGFSINPTTGVLTALAGSPYTAATGGVRAVGLAIDPGGNFLYTANQTSGNISAFNINLTNGVLTPNTISGPTFPAGLLPAIVFATAPTAYQNNFFFGMVLSN
jgi:6-phosphogluconolactonase (cycloisomerase 2 family)